MTQENSIKYRFVTYITGDVEPDYAKWMRDERVRKIMDQRDEGDKQLLSNPVLDYAVQTDGTKVYKLEFDTTPEKFAKYGERSVEMKAHTGAAYKDYGIFTDKSQLAFGIEFSNKDGYGNLLKSKDTGELLKFKPVDIERKAEYTVRVNIDHPENLSRPYEDWIKEHVEQMKELKDSKGQQIYTGASVKKGQENGKDIYVVDYKTTNLKFWDYENLHADKMRGDFLKTYPDPKVPGMSFDRDLYEEGSGFARKAEHDRKKAGSNGQPLTFDAIHSYGMEKAA